MNLESNGVSQKLTQGLKASKQEEKMALKTQLNFHEKVLSVRCCQSQFAMISGSKMKEIGSLIKNLKEVIS